MNPSEWRSEGKLAKPNIEKESNKHSGVVEDHVNFIKLNLYDVL